MNFSKTQNTHEVFNHSLKLINDLKIFIHKHEEKRIQIFYETIYPLFCAYRIPETLIRNENSFKTRLIISTKAILKTLIIIFKYLILSSINSFKRANHHNVDILYLNFSKRHLKETFTDVLPHLKGLKKIYIGRRDELHENELIQFIKIEKFISLRLFYNAIVIFYKNFKSNYQILKKFVKEKNNIAISPFFLEIAIYHNFQHAIYSKLSRELLNLYNPKLVITADDNNPRCRSLIIEAKNNDVKTLLIQQGLSSDLAIDYNFFIGDQIAAINKISKKTFLKMGIANSKISITGRPSFSRLRGNNKKNKNKILFTSQPYSGGILFKNSEERIKYLEILYGDFKKLNNTFLEVKPHPDESRDTHLSIKKKLNFKKLKIYDANSDTTKLLNQSDFLISLGSTTIIEGAISQSLVMIFDPFNRMGDFDYFNNEVSIYNDIKTLCKEIRLLSKNTNMYYKKLSAQNKNIADYLVNHDSAFKVSQLIRNRM